MTTIRRVRVYAVTVGLSMWCLCLSKAEHVSPKEDKAYDLARITNICDALMYSSELYRQRDIPGQVALLRHQEPWVRQYVFEILRGQTNLKDICRKPSFLRFDPWAVQSTIETQVTAFAALVVSNASIVKYTVNMSSLTPAQLDEMRITDQDVTYRGCRIAELAASQLTAGNKSAVYLLTALLDYPSIVVQSRALRTLLGAIQPELYPKDRSGLNLPSPDPAVLNATKQAWFGWWKTNEATVKVYYHSPGM